MARNDEGSWHYSCIFYKVLWTSYGPSNFQQNSLVGTASSGALNCLGKMVENFNSPQIFAEGVRGPIIIACDRDPNLNNRADLGRFGPTPGDFLDVFLKIENIGGDFGELWRLNRVADISFLFAYNEAIWTGNRCTKRKLGSLRFDGATAV